MLQNIWFITKREFEARFRRPSFIAAVGISAAMFTVFYLFASMALLLTNSDSVEVAVINESGQANITNRNMRDFLDSEIRRAADNPDRIKLKAVDPADKKAALRNVSETGYYSVIVVRQKGDELVFDIASRRSWYSLTNQNLTTALDKVVVTYRFEREGLGDPQKYVRMARGADVSFYDSDEIPALLARQASPTNDAESDKADETKVASTRTENTLTNMLTGALVTALFAITTVSGQTIAYGVAEEKGNRSMEVLLTAARPTQLLYGKIFGITLVGIATFGLSIAISMPFNILFFILGAGILYLTGILSPSSLMNSATRSNGANSGTATNTSNPDALASLFTTENIEAAGSITWYIAQTGTSFLIFFFLGYFMQAALFASVGSLCSHRLEVSSALTPLQIFNMLLVYSGLGCIFFVDETWVKILSFIPPFSPVMMFVRIGTRTTSLIEVLICVVILVGFILFANWLAARIYRVGVLIYGQRPSLFKIVSQIFSS